MEFLDYFRQLNFFSIFLRLLLAVIFGGLIGMDRARKHRPAGFRTYMLVCLGAALTMVLSQYDAAMLSTVWGAKVSTDVSRFGAQVINGIGFLGAGTILVTGRQEVKGLTTAAGLWASACMGLAVGAGFYECVVLAFALIFLSMRLLTPLENAIVESSRNMNIYVEFCTMDDIGAIIGCLKAQDAHIYEVEIDRNRETNPHGPSAVFSIRLSQRNSHARLLAAIAELDHIYAIDEI